MIDIILNIDDNTMQSLLLAEKRSLSIIKSRLDYRRSLGQVVVSVDADMFRKRLFLSRIEDLKSLSGIKRSMLREKDFIDAVSRVRPDNILIDLPSEFGGRKGAEVDIDMLLQIREKKYSKALRLCDKLERVGLTVVPGKADDNGFQENREFSIQKEREKTLFQLQSFERDLPLMRKKIYKLFFSLERRNLYSFIKNQMDDSMLSIFQAEADKPIKKEISRKRA